MADEVKEEVVGEEKPETEVEEKSAEIQEADKVNAEFDKKINGDDDDSAIEDTSDEEVPEEKEKVDEEIPAETEDINKEADILEKEILAANRPVEKTTEEPVEEATEEPVGNEEQPFDCGLDPDEYDEGLIASVNKLGGDLTAKIKSLQSEKEELVQAIINQDNQRYTEWFDSKVNSLGEDFKEVLGEGDIDDIEPASVAFENRGKLASRINLIVQTYQRLGKPVPSRNKVFDQAVSYLFNKQKNKSKTELETASKLKARAGQVIGKGSSKSSALSAEAKAKQIISDFDKKIKET